MAEGATGTHAAGSFTSGRPPSQGTPVLALRVDEIGDARPRRLLRSVPDARVGGRDAPLRRHGRGFGEYQSGTPDRPAAEVHEVPIVWHAVHRRVFAHWRDGNAVAQGDVADGQRAEQ